MVTVVRDSINPSPALDVKPLGEPSLAEPLKQLDNLVAVGLIVCYKIAFMFKSYLSLIHYHNCKNFIPRPKAIPLLSITLPSP